MRIGSVAAAPFVGDEFVSLYAGATRVPTVPGKPAWDGTPPASGGSYLEGPFLAPVNDGGSEIIEYRVYRFDGSPTQTNLSLELEFSEPGVYEIAVAAINAVGEGPRLKTVYEYVED